MFFSHSDATVGDLSFVRTFNSARSQGGRFGAFGARWNHSFETRLRFIKPRLIEVRLGDGEPIIYQDTLATGLFTAAFPTSSASWLETIAGGYKRTFRLGGYETYDSAGRMLTSVDRGGVATNYTRDSDGRLVQVARLGRTIVIGYQGADTKPLQLQGPGGAVLASYSYNAGQELEQVTYGDGSGYRYVYDGFGRVNLITDLADKLVERHEYDASGRAIVSEIGEGKEKLSISYGTNQTTVTDALGNGTLYEYQLVDRIPRVKKITGPCISCGDSGDSQEWTYFDTGQIKTYKNGDLKTWTYDYYFPEGDLKTETDPLGRVTTYTYENGHLKTRTALGEGTTTITEGPAGPLSVQDGLNQTTEITYHATLGKPETIKDPRLKITTLVYDTQTGDLTSVKDPLDHSTSFGYDAYGRRTTVTDPLNHTTTTAYDARGRVTRVTSHDGTYTDFKYDKGGRRTEVIDPLRRSTRYLYDVYGRLETVVDAMNGTTKYGYDAMSNLTSLTDANGNTTSFEYFPSRQVKKVVYPGGAFESFTYSPSGRLQTKTDRKNVTTTYTYDDVGRLTGKTYSDGTLPVTYTYTFNAAGRVDTAANGTDTLTWTFDLAGQLLSEQSSKNASTVAYTYDPAGNRLSVSLDGSLFVSYGYDDANNLTTISRGTNVFSFGYDNADRRTSLNFPNGVNTSYGFDSVDRLASVAATKGAATITSFGYSYDNAGHKLTRVQPDYTESYGYDALYRLTQVQRTGSLTGIQTFSYDIVGNRLTNQKDGAVTTGSYNEKNQLTSVAGGGTMLWRGTLDEPGNVTFTSALVNGKPARMLAGNIFEAILSMQPGSNTVTLQATDTSGNVATKSYSVNVTGDGATYTYDANANLAQKVQGADTWTYEWNAENQLTKVRKNGSDVATLRYDPTGRRVEKIGAGITTTYLWDDDDVLRESASDGSSARFINTDSIDEPLAHENGSGTLVFHHLDALSSVRKTTDSTGAVLEDIDYDAFGIQQGTGGRRGYTGRERDAESGFLYLRNRYYDPEAGRFINEDPAGHLDGVNLFAYVGNAPTSFTDPLGLFNVGGIPASRRQQVDEAIKAAMKRLDETSCCFGGRAPDLKKVVQKAKYRYKPIIWATNPGGSRTKACGMAPVIPRPIPLWVMRRIYVSDLAFDPAQCQALECTIVHEAAHILFRDKSELTPEAAERCLGCRP
jgi:RHS repeat-associated protein